MQVRVKCNEDDTVGDLKKLIAAQTGTKWDKIVLKKWYTIYKVGSVSAPGGVQACLKSGHVEVNFFPKIEQYYRAEGIS